MKAVAMFARLGPLGVLALVLALGCGYAAILKGSIVAGVVAVPAIGYVFMQLFRRGDA